MSRRLPTSRERAIRVAGIDVGSNSVHMVVAQVDAQGGLLPLHRMKESLQIGAATFSSGTIPRPIVDRVVATLARFQEAATRYQCEKIVAVATSAVREAVNGGDLLEKVQEKTGLGVRIISGRDEAKLIYLGVRYAMPLKRRQLILDIGGGSVEFIVADHNQAYLLESHKLGAARVTSAHIHSDPISKSDKHAVLRAYSDQLTTLCDRIRKLEPVGAIGTSGTLENLASMSQKGQDSETIERRHLDQLMETLISSTSAQRARMPGLDEFRKDQIVAGALLVHELMRRLQIGRIHMCKSALREGILVNYVNRNAPDLRIREQIPEPRRRSIFALARRCEWHKTHSEQVTRLCMILFDQLKSIHGLGDTDRELVEYGALLHDIGWHVERRNHHKHSMYLIRNGNLKNFSDQEIEIIANIARYHRRAIPKKKHAAYQALAPRARRVVDIGASLLRIADGLDRSHASVVDDLKCKISDTSVRCVVASATDAQLELWAANRKRDLFESVFHRSIHFELRT